MTVNDTIPAEQIPYVSYIAMQREVEKIQAELDSMPPLDQQDAAQKRRYTVLQYRKSNFVDCWMPPRKKALDRYAFLCDIPFEVADLYWWARENGWKDICVWNEQPGGRDPQDGVMKSIPAL